MIFKIFLKLLKKSANFPYFKSTLTFLKLKNNKYFILESFHLNNETVIVAPASGFYSTKNEGKNQVRIAYVLNKQDLIKSVLILKEALKVYPG